MNIELSTRRDFLKQMSILTASIMVPLPFSGCGNSGRDSIGEMLPKRMLGKTGQEVTMLGLGGYHIGWTTEKDAQETIEAALEGGIRFFDTAESYGPHTSEIRFGKYLIPNYRDKIFIMTKTNSNDAKTAITHLEESLSRMNCDYIDLWQLHAIFTPEDVENRVERGVLEVLQDAKASGKVKYIGFTGHQNAYAHAKMLDLTNDGALFDTCQLPINVVDAMSSVSFTNLILPRLVSGNIGVIGMKSLADGRFFAKKLQENRQVWQTENPIIPRKVTIDQAMNFVWSLPVSTLVTGAENAEMLKEKIELAKTFMKLSDQERRDLMNTVADVPNLEEVEYYKS
jgi:uncharacterized protein